MKISKLLAVLLAVVIFVGAGAALVKAQQQAPETATAAEVPTGAKFVADDFIKAYNRFVAAYNCVTRPKFELNYVFAEDALKEIKAAMPLGLEYVASIVQNFNKGAGTILFEGKFDQQQVIDWTALLNNKAEIIELYLAKNGVDCAAGTKTEAAKAAPAAKALPNTAAVR